MADFAAHMVMAWLSPSYPLGAFSYSHGLEYAVQSGGVRTADDLAAWLSDILAFGAGRNDAILLAAAYRAEDAAALAEVAELAAALPGSSERHLETMAQGAAFAKVTSAVLAQDMAQMALPVAIGAAAKAEGIALETLLPLYLHGFCANLVSAGVRFVPLGQTEGQMVLAGLFPLFEAVAQEALAADLEDLGGCAILGDLAALGHETMKPRIYRT